MDVIAIRSRRACKVSDFGVHIVAHLLYHLRRFTTQFLHPSQNLNLHLHSQAKIEWQVCNY